MLQLRTVPAEGKKKRKRSVLFRLKGGKEAVAEAGGRVAEENRTSQGVSLPDKQGLGFRGRQPLLRELFAFKSGGRCPPGQEKPLLPGCKRH